MEIKIKPPASISSSPFATGTWYNLEVTRAFFNMNAKIQEYKIKDKNKFVFEEYTHSSSTMMFNGVITASSGLPGATLEAKKENLIEAASAWWTFGDQATRTNCAHIYWRGWDQYMMIERLAIEKTAGDEESYDYELTVVIHEGK